MRGTLATDVPLVTDSFSTLTVSLAFTFTSMRRFRRLGHARRANRCGSGMPRASSKCGEARWRAHPPGTTRAAPTAPIGLVQRVHCATLMSSSRTGDWPLPLPWAALWVVALLPVHGCNHDRTNLEDLEARTGRPPVPVGQGQSANMRAGSKGEAVSARGLAAGDEARHASGGLGPTSNQLSNTNGPGGASGSAGAGGAPSRPSER